MATPSLPRLSSSSPKPPFTRRSPSLPAELSERLFSLVTSSQPDLPEALELIRRKELDEGEITAKGKFAAKGRCPVCTLALPCEHFKSKREARKAAHRHISKPDEPPRASSIPAIERPVDQSLDDQYPANPSTDRPFRIRYRSSNDITFSMSARPKAFSLKETRRMELRRIRIIEKIDEYRKSKCEKEIEKIEEYKRKEETAKQEALLKDEKRKQRDKLLKAELEKYHTEMMKSKQSKQETLLREMQDERLRERRRLKYIRKQVSARQKEKIESYKLKKQMIDGIQRDQVGELGED